MARLFFWSTIFRKRKSRSRYSKQLSGVVQSIKLFVRLARHGNDQKGTPFWSFP